MAESLGRYLRRERQMRDVTLEQIVRETKIKRTLLDAMEDDRFEALPSPAIVKGFLRSYADVVGLSGQSLVLRYESILEEQGRGAKSGFFIRQPVSRKPRRLAPVIWLLLAVLALGVGIRFLGGDPPPPAGPPLPADEAAGPVVYRKNYLRGLSDVKQPDTRYGTPAHLAATSPAELGPPSGGIHLVLRARAPVSVRLALDRGEFATITLSPGQAVARHALRAALVETQRPGRVAVEANGREIPAGLAATGPVRFLLSAPETASIDADEDGGALPPVRARVIPLRSGHSDFSASPEAFFPE